MLTSVQGQLGQLIKGSNMSYTYKYDSAMTGLEIHEHLNMCEEITDRDTNMQWLTWVPAGIFTGKLKKDPT